MTRDEAQLAWEIIVDKGYSDYKSLSRDERVWFNIEPLTTDGLWDDYMNTGAEFNAETIEDLDYIGFNSVANLLREFNQIYFPAGVPIVDIYNLLWIAFYLWILKVFDNKPLRRCENI